MASIMANRPPRKTISIRLAIPTERQLRREARAAKLTFNGYCRALLEAYAPGEGSDDAEQRAEKMRKAAALAMLKEL
jgi:hypothetical protein